VSRAGKGGAPLRMPPRITGVGLATAQGSAADLAAGRPLHPPLPVPWPPGRFSACGLYRPARGVDPGWTGPRRWNALARQALAECLGPGTPDPLPPLLLASSNGGAGSFDAEQWRRSFDPGPLLAGTPWAARELPLPAVSVACASGLQALDLARRLLAAGREAVPGGEVVVLAADILPRASQENFESLRILAPALAPPWQPGGEGFLLGEAAVALRLTIGDGEGPWLLGPALGHDLAADEGLATTLARLAWEEPDLVLGQGTGPWEVDRVELAAVRRALGEEGAPSVPLTTPLFHFGHTLGASGLLSVALAALLARGRELPCLALPAARAGDGRPLVQGGGGEGRESLIVCRALGGACGAAVVRAAPPRREIAPAGPSPGWAEPPPPEPLGHPALRRLAAELPRLRPAAPPDLLLVRLAEPLVPPQRSVRGGRILPSAVLEMTPGRAALLAARAWGFAGPTLCLVGAPGDPGPPGLPPGLALPGRRISVIELSPTGALHVPETGGRHPTRT